MLDKEGDIAGEDLAVDLALMALLVEAKKSRKCPFIDMVMWRHVQSLYPTDLPGSFTKYVGQFFLPSQSMLRSAVY